MSPLRTTTYKAEYQERSDEPDSYTETELSPVDLVILPSELVEGAHFTPDHVRALPRHPSQRIRLTAVNSGESAVLESTVLRRWEVVEGVGGC